MNAELRDVLASHLDDVVPPSGDLAGVTRRGRAVRRRRVGGVIAASALTMATLGVTATQLDDDGPTNSVASPDHPRYMKLAAFSGSEGLRAFADPSSTGKINLGDTLYSRKDMEYLDTDASATPSGMVFFDKDQKPRLLGSDGRVVELGDGPAKPDPKFHPSSKVDSKRPYVAWTENHGSLVRVVVYDLPSRSIVSSRDVPCSAKACSKIKVDGLDDGVAFVRAPDGTFVWQVADDSWTQLGGPELRVADVRNRTILWADEAPTMPSGPWRYVEGKIDAQLTFDGENVLYWSNRLAPTASGGKEIRLDAGSKDKGWYTIDTDGSVLVAVETDGSDPTAGLVKADIFDCELPSGACTKIGAISTDSGHPMFIGDDM